MSQEDEIPKHYQSLFTQNVETLVQKEGSLLLPWVTTGEYQGESAEVVKQFGPTKARLDDNTRHGDTPIMSTPRDQRWVVPRNVDWGDLFDRNDLMKQLIDPTSPITRNAGFAMGGGLDTIIIDSLFGDAKTGKAGTTTTEFPTDDSQDVDITVGSNAATGMNIAKLIEGRRILRANYAIKAGDPLIFIGAAQQEADMFGDEKFINTRYTRTTRLEDAKLSEFFNVTFVFLEELPTETGHADYRQCVLYPQSAIHLGRWNGGVKTFLARNPQKKFNWQLYMCDSAGSTRTQEKKVVRITCKE